jgi:hypothetical protein
MCRSRSEVAGLTSVATRRVMPAKKLPQGSLGPSAEDAMVVFRRLVARSRTGRESENRGADPPLASTRIIGVRYVLRH